MKLLEYKASPVHSISGSHGEFEVDRNGYVLNHVTYCDDTCECDGLGYSEVFRVDVEELKLFYETHWNLQALYLCGLDVCEVSWWRKDGIYSPASMYFRIEMLSRIRDGIKNWDFDEVFNRQEVAHG